MVKLYKKKVFNPLRRPQFDQTNHLQDKYFISGVLKNSKTKGN